LDPWPPRVSYVGSRGDVMGTALHFISKPATSAHGTTRTNRLSSTESASGANRKTFARF